MPGWHLYCSYRVLTLPVLAEKWRKKDTLLSAACGTLHAIGLPVDRYIVPGAI
jgi:hypothetical protein